MNPVDTKGLLAVILAGGQGERLYPLTKDRAKPAVPFAGTYRIIDFPLSNCVNSGLRRIYVLTQYRSISLQRHINLAWNIFRYDLGEFIGTVPPQLRRANHWYLGTADAIYQNIYTLEVERPDRVLILSGDHVYKMDYAEMIRAHIDRKADLTVACMEVPREEAHRFGVMQVDTDFRITAFWEKPADPPALPGKPDRSLISMGIYVFETPVLVRRVVEDSKRDTSHDFGKDIIPAMVGTDRVYAFSFQPPGGEPPYWRDIGTLDAYWKANMDLIQVVPPFNLYDVRWPIRTYQPQLPPAKTVFSEDQPGGRVGTALNSLLSCGCIISGGRVERSVLSPGVRIDAGAVVADSVVLDNTTIGQGARIHRAIVDKNVVVPPGMAIGIDHEQDRRLFTVTANGIVVVPKEAPLTEMVARGHIPVKP